MQYLFLLSLLTFDGFNVFLTQSFSKYMLYFHNAPANFIMHQAESKTYVTQIRGNIFTYFPFHYIISIACIIAFAFISSFACLHFLTSPHRFCYSFSNFNLDNSCCLLSYVLNWYSTVNMNNIWEFIKLSVLA